MGYRRHYGRSGGYGSRDFGMEAALRHIEEARIFSHEIGGTDADVKQYFFGLSGQALEQILSAYGRANGRQAEAYARRMFNRWKAGSTQMSGLVAKRLFSLLPPTMRLIPLFQVCLDVVARCELPICADCRVG